MDENIDWVRLIEEVIGRYVFIKFLTDRDFLNTISVAVLQSSVEYMIIGGYIIYEKRVIGLGKDKLLKGKQAG